MEGVVFITDRAFENEAKRLEKENLNRYGKSICASSIMGAAHEYIYEIQPDRKGMIVRLGWSDAMNAEADKIEPYKLREGAGWVNLSNKVFRKYAKSLDFGTEVSTPDHCLIVEFSITVGNPIVRIASPSISGKYDCIHIKTMEQLDALYVLLSGAPF